MKWSLLETICGFAVCLASVQKQNMGLYSFGMKVRMTEGPVLDLAMLSVILQRQYEGNKEFSF